MSNPKIILLIQKYKDGVLIFFLFLSQRCVKIHGLNTATLLKALLDFIDFFGFFSVQEGFTLSEIACKSKGK